jgi:hypothetical protein
LNLQQAALLRPTDHSDLTALSDEIGKQRDDVDPHVFPPPGSRAAFSTVAAATSPWH